MEVKLFEIAERIRCLREILEITPEEMAAACMVTPEEYARLEEGNSDFSYSFLVKCAETLGVDTVELITGETPKLSFYSIIRKGRGLPIKRRKGFTYDHMGYLFRGRECEPMLVVAPYSEEEQNAPIHLSHHSGQEFDYILSGSLRVEFEGGGSHVLHAGDCVYYDSGHGHGMIAVGGEDCQFLAIVLKSDKKEER